MKRIAAGVLIAPVIWPWVFNPVTWLAYIVITGNMIHYYWLTPLHNLHLFWWAYVLMVVFGSPFVYLGVRRKWQEFWTYLVIGALIGFLVPIVFVTGAAYFETHAGEVTLYLALLQSNMHMISGATVASGLMFFAYWAIGVRNNAVYEAAT